MTFSIVARCRLTGIFGVAVASSSPAVSARCAYVKSGVGAMASQNVTDPALGLRGLDLMSLGASASETVGILARTAEHIQHRQLLAVDVAGGSATFSGGRALGMWAEARGEDVACGGNLLANDGVPQAMVKSFTETTGHLGDRLVVAMRAGLVAGGEVGAIHSSGLKLAGEVAWPIADLRCDWTDACPIEDLSKLWERYKPQLGDYVARALNPDTAPRYGVPGDE